MRHRHTTVRHVPDQVTRLYGLVLVEEHGATQVLTSDLANQRDDAYANGRLGGYAFVLEAMELYWPELKPFGERMRAAFPIIEANKKDP